jgi:triosephosphate isomerase (TIM)
MRKKIVAGNWKMNTDLMEAVTLVKTIQECSKDIMDVEKVVFPPFPFIKTITEITNEEKSFFTGAQNCSEHVKGAYTGETAASMLASIGCKYVLVGHSERRSYFNENNSQLAAKVNNVLAAGLKVMFCFGEQLAERKGGKYFDTVRVQLEEGLKNFSPDKMDDLVLAYEPVWAIGTGETASPGQAQEMHQYVRELMASKYNPKIAQSISILYGGSCNAQNAKELFACPDVDGGLIGGASLKGEEFCKILHSFS